MPFQPFNYAALEPQGNPVMRNLIESLSAGYKAGQMPGQLRREAQEKELANALNQMKLQNEPEENRIAQALKQAQIKELERKANLPFGGDNLQGFAGQANDIYRLEQQLGANHPTVKLAKQLANVEIQSKQTRINRNNALIDTTDLRLLSPDARREREGLGRALGLTPEELNQRTRNGESIADIAQSQGKDVSQLEPIYALTPSEVKDVRQREAFSKEIDSLSSNIVGPLSETARQVMGYPVDMIYKQLNGKLSDDEFGKILAAGALVPELNAIRYRNLGGRVGITALRDMEEKIHAKFKTLPLSVDSKAYKAMDKYLTEWINQGVNAYSDSIKENAKIKSSSNENPKDVGPPPFTENKLSEKNEKPRRKFSAVTGKEVIK